MAITPKIRALIQYANEKTGAADTTLGDAVKTLCDGYGGGGGGYYEGTFILSSNTNTTPLLTHNLGTTRLLLTIELVADTRQAVTSGYSPLYATFNTLILDYKAKVDYSSYSQHKGEVDIDCSVGYPNGQNCWGSVMQSPYSSQNQDVYSAVVASTKNTTYLALTANAIQVKFSFNLCAGLTYKYRIWKLD